MTEKINTNDQKNPPFTIHHPKTISPPFLLPNSLVEIMNDVRNGFLWGSKIPPNDDMRIPPFFLDPTPYLLLMTGSHRLVLNGESP